MKQGRIEITTNADVTRFFVAIVAHTGVGDEMARVLVPPVRDYDDAILSAGRYSQATGLPVVDLVVT